MTDIKKYLKSNEVKKYLESVDGAAHMSAVEIIEKLEKEVERLVRTKSVLLDYLKNLRDYKTTVKTIVEVIEEQE